MAKGIRNIHQTPPGMSPLNPSPEVEGMPCILKDGQKDKDRSVSQEKRHDKRRRKDSPQGRKDRRVRRGSQKENHSCGATDDLQKDEKNKKDLKPRNEDKKNGKDERIESERKYPHWNLRSEIKSEENDIEEQKPRKVPHGDDNE
jgi:hypothetical protein